MFSKEIWSAAKEIEKIFNTQQKLNTNLTCQEFLDAVPGLEITQEVHLFKVAQQVGLTVASLQRQYG